MLNPLLPKEGMPAGEREPKKIDFSSVPMTGKCRASGVSVRESLLQRLDHIRDELNLESRNQVAVYALRYFVLKYQEGVTGIERCVVQPPVAKGSLDMGDDS